MLTSPSANFITELVVFTEIISIYSTQPGNLFGEERNQCICVDETLRGKPTTGIHTDILDR